MTDDPAPAVMRLAEFARLRNVTKAAVTKWRARGLLVMTPDGRVDVGASNALLNARHYQGGGRKSKAAPGMPPNRPERSAGELVAPAAALVTPESWTTAEAVRRERIAMAKLREIEAAEAAGLVAPVADFKKAVAAEYALVRAPLLGLASKLAHRLAACTTPEGCGALVDGEVKAILTALTLDEAK